MKSLNSAIDNIASNKRLRTLLHYILDRQEGLQYGSYSIEDEVSLALSFIGDSRGAVIDAGANKGDWSRQLLSSGAIIEKLIAIEPQITHMTALNRLSINNPQVIVEHVAIGSTSQKQTLYKDDEGSSWASLYKRDLSHVGVEMTRQEFVQVTTLDALVEKHSIQHIAFLKLDLEGNEFEALKGAKSLLERQAIGSIVFEFGGCSIDSRIYIKDFWSLLVCQHQFSFYRLLPKRRLMRMPKYSESLEQFNWQNILCCAPGIKPKWKIIN